MSLLLHYFFQSIQSIEEAILIGEAATIYTHVTPQLLSIDATSLSADDAIRVNETLRVVIEKFETALTLNPTNYHTLFLLYLCGGDGHRFLINHKLNDEGLKNTCLEFFRLKLFDYAYKFLDHPAIPDHFEDVRGECYYELANIFQLYCNDTAALKYAKLAYEHCLRSSDHAKLSTYKNLYIMSRAAVTELPPLRFAVGDEVEFLERELGTVSVYRLGKVVELHYRERDFDIAFNAPYRIQILFGSDSANQPPVYAWVKADLDCYVHKDGVRPIEITHYHDRLETKVAELARVFCLEEFTHDIYNTLAQDREFVEMLRSVWQIELSVPVLNLYRALVMHIQPLVRTESGYHVPSSEEVVAGIRAFFDPVHLSGDAAPSVAGENSGTQRVRAIVLGVLQDTDTTSIKLTDNNVQRLLFESIRHHMDMTFQPDLSVSTAEIISSDRGSDVTVPPAISEAVSRASSVQDLKYMRTNAIDSTKLLHYLDTWIFLLACLENPSNTTGAACECSFVYFFVRSCLNRHTGVPKPALALYDRMNMQLSREFIRCANPTCELNKLDKSTGKIKFKKCSRCQAVIYCSRECQVAHYPEHKRLCREGATG